MNQEAATQLSIARSNLLLDHPFFGVLALRLGLEESLSIPTLGVDGKVICYNPDFILGLSPTLRMSAVAHEVMHCVLDHIGRRQGRDPKRWNSAADYALNPIIKEAGLPLGDDWLFKKEWVGKSAEEIYGLLPEDFGVGLCEVLDAPEDQDEDSALDWKLATVQAAKAQQARGNLPDLLKKFVKELIEPHVNWRDVLWPFMVDKARDDYSWQRPNPYYLDAGFYFPSVGGVGMGEVVIALDTSGSVRQALDEFAGAVSSVITAVSPTRVHVIYCDAAVNKVDLFERGQPLHFEAIGGGGTDFRPVFEYVEKHNITPACLLYLTDMYGRFPEKAPQYPTLWCATSDKIGPFGQTVALN